MRRTFIYGLAAATALVAGSASNAAGKAQASEQEVFLAQELPEATIVEAYVARQEKCNLFLCGKWEPVDLPKGGIRSGDNPVGFGAIFEPKPDNRVCVWDIKIVTRADHSQKAATHVFPKVTLCTPQGSTNLLIKQAGTDDRIFTAEPGGKIYAVQSYVDESGETKEIYLEPKAE